ncbi:YkvA family protein [Henriciella sp.]|uniref:YkvA family protein n=1 Tax=Henriciella sp. TaxID=1968823 RepID=UPI002614CB4E|nr:YkvA family protein [Henriciella sp.]
MRNPREIVIENGSDQPMYLPLPIEQDRARTKRRFIPKLLRLAGRLPFADDLAAAYYAAIDPQTPRKAKAVLFAALAYFVTPTDAVPDLIAGLGFTDDATVLATALSIVGVQIRDRHRRAARRLLGLPEPAAEDN